MLSVEPHSKRTRITLSITETPQMRRKRPYGEITTEKDEYKEGPIVNNQRHKWVCGLNSGECSYIS